MACSVPVLTTRKVNIWREVETSGGGMAEADTPAGISRLLTRWLELTDNEKTAMRAAARAGYDTHFRMEVASASLYSVLSKQVVQGHKAA